MIDTLDIYEGLLANTQVSEADKASIRSKATDLIKKITTESLVYDPRGAYLSLDSGVSRTEYTAGMISVVQRLNLPGEVLPAQIQDNMMRFLASMKK